MKYNWENMTDLQKDKAVRDELKLETNNGTTKDDLTEIMRYQAGKIETVKEYCKRQIEEVEDDNDELVINLDEIRYDNGRMDVLHCISMILEDDNENE